MDKISVGTSQNVTIEYEIASVGDRILAALFDGLIVTLYAVLIGFSGALLSSLLGLTGMVILIVLGLPVLFYSLLCEVFMNGQSYGKKKRNIKVIRTDGAPVTFGNYLMRWLFRLVEVIPYGLIAIITIILNGKGQRLADIAAGTAVIKIRKKEKSLNPDKYKPDENYLPVFPQAESLTDPDIALIYQVLDSEAQYSEALYEKLAAKLKNKMQIETSLKTREFLMVVLKDFNFIHGRVHDL